MGVNKASANEIIELGSVIACTKGPPGPFIEFVGTGYPYGMHDD
ncbi:hypothetical protein QUC32_29495 (plasmid) [Novosphingobium resinovorum]|nr:MULTISPECIES: hypothetical protein [Novosphingobium]WJM29801.1 hypothetical protein QUC32_29495 [Novosphingobium resinovorum]